MRNEFWRIVSGWQEDDLVRLGERIGSAATWLDRHGGAARAEADELAEYELMFRRQIVRAVHAGAFEPFVRAGLDDDEIIKTVLGDGTPPEGGR